MTAGASQEYIHYEKGSPAMCALKQYPGGTVNCARRRFLRASQYQSPSRRNRRFCRGE